ncbi:MAG: hypothetical protein WCF65_07605 [Parachlamydiaceae bacterium]
MDNYSGHIEEIRTIHQNALHMVAEPTYQIENISIISTYLGNSRSLRKVIRAFMTDKDYMNQTDLCAIMSTHGSDKGGLNARHNYTTLYTKLFHSIKSETINVFELGLGTNDVTIPSNMGVNGIPGASHYGWEEYFTDGRIFGADIDKKILFNTDRIRTYYCDQLSQASISDMWTDPTLKEIAFDIIIEDGLHSFEANLIFLENSLYKLKKGGIFIIEDLTQETVLRFEGIKNALIRRYNLQDLCILSIPAKQSYDNTLLIILK